MKTHLFVNNPKESGYSWVIENNKLSFRHRDSNNTTLFNSENIISTSLSYANEIEKII